MKTESVGKDCALTDENVRKKFLMIGPKTKAVVNFRGDLLRDIRKSGYDVVVVSPEDDCHDFFRDNNIKLRLVKLNKNSVSISGGVAYYKKLKEIIEDEKPDVVFSFTVKPVIFGSVAAKNAGVERIYSLICGLGLLFSSNSFYIKVLQKLVGKMYEYSLKYNKKVFFQNKDDIKEFINRGYINRSRCVLVNGSGVNLKKFKRNRIPKGEISFLMVSRVLREKGVLEYFEAARTVKKQYPETRFVYIGAIDKNKNAIKLKSLRPYFESGIVEYVPETNEVEKYVAQSSVFVLPSYYREGVPRTLLEALAMGRPIITTRTPGCKETVREGVNGVFVEPRNVGDLVEKMEWMLKNRERLQEMGDESYKMCLEKFEVGVINAGMMELMGMKNRL